MARNGKTILLVGLPEAGKSTFAAALWGVVNSEEIPDSLKFQTYTGDDTYLQALYDKWARAEKVDRTFLKNEGLGILALVDPKDRTATVAKVVITDLAGERFANQWEKRRISTELDQYFKEVDSILLFLHSKKIKDGFIIDDALREIDEVIADATTEEFSLTSEGFENKITSQEISGNSSLPDDEESAVTILEKPFSLKDIQTQTIIVDVLQSGLSIGKNIRRIAIVISAWDLISKDTSNPSEWLRGRMPLLTQYLRSNVDRFDFRIWGISAQGFDFTTKDQAEREKFLKLRAVNRIVVTDGKKSDSDITRPIKWLFSDHSSQ